MLPGDHAEVVREVTDPKEEHDQDAAEPVEDDAGVLRFGGLEGRHSVRDRFDTRERGTPRGKRPEQQEESDALEPRPVGFIGSLGEKIEDRAE